MKKLTYLLTFLLFISFINLFAQDSFNLSIETASLSPISLTPGSTININYLVTGTAPRSCTQQSTADVNLSAYNNGIYLVRVIDVKGKEVFVNQIVLQK